MPTIAMPETPETPETPTPNVPYWRPKRARPLHRDLAKRLFYATQERMLINFLDLSEDMVKNALSDLEVPTLEDAVVYWS